MNRLGIAWSWITNSPLRAVAAAAVAVTALVAGVAFAGFVNGLREPDVTAGAPSASAAVTPSASASASATASPSPTPVPSPSATAVMTPTAAPTVTPIPATPAPSEPAVASVQLPIGLGAMSITEGLRVRSEPSDQAVVYQPTLSKGTTFRLVDGPILASGYTWYRVADLSTPLDGNVDGGWVAVAATDGTPWIGPSLDGCLAFEFPTSPITVASLVELQDGVLGTWVGCVETPWVPPYPVILTFRDDGTYSSVALAPGEPAMYYGSDDDSPEKRYALNDLPDSLMGFGQIDIFFWEGNTNRGELRNITLMGDQLEVEFFHRGQYGPLTYRLYRVDASE